MEISAKQWHKIFLTACVVFVLTAFLHAIFGIPVYSEFGFTLLLAYGVIGSGIGAAITYNSD